MNTKAIFCFVLGCKYVYFCCKVRHFNIEVKWDLLLFEINTGGALNVALQHSRHTLFPQSKDMHVRLIDGSRLSVGVLVRVHVYSSMCGHSMDWRAVQGEPLPFTRRELGWTPAHPCDPELD